MKKILMFFAGAAFTILIFFSCGFSEYEPRPDIEFHYGIVEERDGLYGSWNPKGQFSAVSREEFNPGDKILTTIYYNPNNNICDDIIKVTHEKIVN